MYIWVIASKNGVQSQTIPTKSLYVLGRVITCGGVSVKIPLLLTTALLLVGMQILYALLSGLYERSLPSQGSSSSVLIYVLMF